MLRNATEALLAEERQVEAAKLQKEQKWEQELANAMKNFTVTFTASPSARPQPLSAGERHRLFMESRREATQAAQVKKDAQHKQNQDTAEDFLLAMKETTQHLNGILLSKTYQAVLKERFDELKKHESSPDYNFRKGFFTENGLIFLQCQRFVELCKLYQKLTIKFIELKPTDSLMRQLKTQEHRASKAQIDGYYQQLTKAFPQLGKDEKGYEPPAAAQVAART